MVRLGLVGFGQQMRKHYFRYLKEREERHGDVQIGWISGYLPVDEEIVGETTCMAKPGDAWLQWIRQPDSVDAVVVSLPNSMHFEAVNSALRCGKHVAVDKPAAIMSSEVTELSALAYATGRMLVTMSQRRYEDLYQELARQLEKGAVGRPFLIHYLIAHDDFGARRDPLASERWELCMERSGGGVLMGSAYHGIDTVLWLLREGNIDLTARSVSATWIIDSVGCPEHPTEGVCNVRVTMEPGPCIFSITASRWNPDGSVDENLKIFGPNGCIRVMRDLERKVDQRAASITYQPKHGKLENLGRVEWQGKRHAPLEDFVNAVAAVKKGDAYKVLSPAEDSLLTVRIIEKAYESAARGGQEISL